MADTGTPPVIPADLQQYNSYVEDPKWQVKFTIVWTSVLAIFALLALPAVVRGRRKWAAEIFGVREDWPRRYIRLNDKDLKSQDTVEKEKKSCCEKVHRIHEQPPVSPRNHRRIVVARIVSALASVFYWTPPGIWLNAGQILLIAGYASAVLACICISAPLMSNPNRAGFLALAQLTPIFLLASKNTPLSLLLPPFFAYTRLNALHRWTGRTLFLAALVHGSLWIRNHVQWNIQILGRQKETSGVAALGVLCVVVLSSLKPVRVWAWGVFYWVHYLAVPAFFIAVCYHTMYAAPWIFPPIAIYAFDILMRAGRFRLKDAHLIRVDNQMTLIHIPDCDAGFRAGQHLRVRVFFGGRAFEAHPLSIMCAPSSSGDTTCLRMSDVAAYYDDVSTSPGGGGAEPATPGILLGARAIGDWTRALNEYALRQEEILASDANNDEEVDDAASSTTGSEAGSSTSPAPHALAKRKPRGARIPVPVQVMFDGPYGGCALELAEYERVLLVAGGSGATFAVGMLDGLVAAAVRARKGRGEGAEVGRVRTRRVHFVWCTRSFGSIKWLAPLLRAIALALAASSAPLSLRMTVYVTCMCSPEEVGVPGLEVLVGGRPEVGRLVRALGGLCEADAEADGVWKEKENEAGAESEEELGVCGCGCAEEGQSRGREGEEGRDVEADGKEERFDGALAVCASGPESLTREAANAVARCAGRGREVGLHTEVFAV